MTDDDFTTAMRAESEARFGFAFDMGIFEEGAEWARAHLAAQETYGERAPCGCDLTGPVPPAVHIVDRHEEPQRLPDRAARRDEDER